MRKPVLMPEPNNIRFHGGYFVLGENECISVDCEAERLYPKLVETINGKLGLKLQTAEKGVDCGLAVKLPDEREFAQAGAAFGISPSTDNLKAGSYYINVDSQAAVLAAKDAEGFFHAVQTLKQLIAGRDIPAGRVMLKNCRIFDYPHVRIRGIHLYLPSRENIPFFRNLIEGLAELKYNTVYFETSAMEYKRHPEINEAWMEYARDMDEYPEKAKTYQSGFHSSERPWYLNSIHIENGGGGYLLQEEVRELVRHCRDNMIDVVPEVQSLSHCGFLTVAHREIAENPEDPYPDAYCPSNPKSYELLFDVIDEVVEVFEPKSISIGHDEWYSAGMCPVCRGKDAALLFAEDITKIHDYLAKKGIRTEMFGDKLLDARTPDGRGQGGAFRIVEDYYTSEVYNTMQPTFTAAGMIPGDILVQHWYWGLEPGAQEYFHKKGLDIIYNNFDSFGMQVRDWEQWSRQPNVLGASLSHWDLVEEDNMAWDGVLTDAVYSSYTMWNESYNNFSWEKVRDLTFSYLPFFMERLGGRKLPSLSLEQKDFIRILLRHAKKEKFYMSTSAVELRNYMRRNISQEFNTGYFRSVRAEVVETGQEFRAAVVNDMADSLVFRHNTDISLPYESSDHGIRPENYLIGYYTVRYSDGTCVRIDLSYGKNIGNAGVRWGIDINPSGIYAVKDIRLLQAAYFTRPWIKTLNDNEQATVYDYEWVNPYPDLKICDIDLSINNMKMPFSVFIYDIYGIRQGDGYGR